MKQYKVLQWAFSFLEKHNREQHVAELLLQHMTKQNPTSFYMNMQEELDQALVEEFMMHIKDHAISGRPIQHIIGQAAFYGRDFFVNEKVLIPRFETEELVLHAIEQIKTHFPNEAVTIADLGTGSGVIAISLALELARASVYASDISEHALAVAAKNAAVHEAAVRFFQGDFLQALIEEGINPELIISNPPYIALDEAGSLTDTVKDFDPQEALFADKQGLAAYETILSQASYLEEKAKRLVIFEIGYKQGAAVSKMIKEVFPNSEVMILQDINGQDRIVSAIIQA